MGSPQARFDHMHHNMVPARTDYGYLRTLWKVTEGIAMAYGPHVPADDEDGYVPGAIVLHPTEGMYVNVGTVDNCKFEEYLPVKTVHDDDLDLEDSDFETNWIELDGEEDDVQITNWTPTPGKTYIINCKNSTNTVSIALSSDITFDDAGNHTATFDTDEGLVVTAISATRLAILADVNSVALSGA